MMRPLILLGALTVLGCPHNNGTDNKPAQGLGSGIVVLKTGGRTVRVRVEVARTDPQRSRGLMFRKKLGAHQGMLFIFDREELQSFWMKNTYIPLDMIFINRVKQVVGIVENAEPMTNTSRSVPTPSTYVLEVRGGFAKAQGISTDTRVELDLE